jgi:hypothetical protein
MSQSRSQTKATKVINWAPQPGPQSAALHCPYPEVFFGGARGGGKSDTVLGRAGWRAGLYGQHYNGVVFRHEMPQSDDLIERARELYHGIAQFNGQTSAFRFANGARLRFRPLSRVEDAQKYQGQNLTDAFIEEAGNYPDSPAPIMRMFGALRSAHGVPTCLFLTGNPGGPGQHWIAQRYVNPAPGGMVPLIQRIGDAQHRAIFIPSKVADNKILLHHDPAYITKLHLVGSRELVRAWLEGDWSAIEGAYFDNWSVTRHVIKARPLPDHWLRFRAIDWGSYRPFSVGWFAVVAEETAIPDGPILPRGALVRYRELYGCKPGAVNVGLKLTVEEVAQQIVSLSADDPNISYTVADPAMFSEDGGPSMAERMALKGVPLLRGDNRRVGRNGQMGGWDMLRARLNGESERRPMIVCFDTCAASIRTIPALQHDPKHPEDCNTEQEDHAADEWRYACMSRPWVQDAPEAYDPAAELRKPLTFDQVAELNELDERKRRRI